MKHVSFMRVLARASTPSRPINAARFAARPCKSSLPRSHEARALVATQTFRSRSAVSGPDPSEEQLRCCIVPALLLLMLVLTTRNLRSIEMRNLGVPEIGFLKPRYHANHDGSITASWYWIVDGGAVPVCPIAIAARPGSNGSSLLPPPPHCL